MSAHKESVKSRYKGYAHPSGARHPNYIIERASPAMLCLVRRAQPRPYMPLPTEVISHRVQPQEYSIRPPPYVSQQAVMEFYRVCHGHYNINCENPSAIDLITLGAHAHGGKGLSYRRSHIEQQLQQHQGQQQQDTKGAGGTGGVGRSTATASASSGYGEVHDFPQAVEDYRLSQLRKNTQHVDSYPSSRVCNFYNTREGCRRGAYCEFLHL